VYITFTSEPYHDSFTNALSTSLFYDFMNEILFQLDGTISLLNIEDSSRTCT